jgi:hypothetical protein
MALMHQGDSSAVGSRLDITPKWVDIQACLSTGWATSQVMKKHIPFFSILLLVNCGGSPFSGNDDFSAKLAGDYYIHRTSPNQINISPNSYDPTDTPIIPPKVVECDFNSRFIIARQQELQRRNPNKTNDHFMVPAPGKFHYWILDVNAPKAYGPLTLQEFTAQRKSLGVPESLSLKDVYSFKK